MPNQIQDGLHNMALNAGHAYPHNTDSNNAPSFSPFPKVVDPPRNVPPSDEETEAIIENARLGVLSSNDPEMQLTWSADALVYVSVSADNEERIASANPRKARAATPRIEHQLKQDAMNIVTFLADQKHPKAEFLRGQWWEWGRFGQREDKKAAFRSYSRAADRGYARAHYRIGMLHESYNDPIKALRHYHLGVDAGDAASCYRLGMMTLRGQHGQQQDFGRGVDLIRQSAFSADENAAQGAYVYGMLLARQLPQIEIPEAILPYDAREAKNNIEKAAYLKFAKAQLKMGSLYELGGLGCDFNPALSIHYNALASRQGEAEADMALSKWFLVGSEGLFPKNEDLAYKYAESAAQAGLATAEFALGYFHEIGMKVPVDLDKAMEWYAKASKHGNEDAQGRIDGIMHKQVLSRKDHENVAIKRITSMYGSQRGGRPARFGGAGQQGSSRLGQVSEQAEYGGGTPPPVMNGYLRLSGGAVQPPSRESNTTPYPIDDRPPTVPPMGGRSASVAPYPLEDGPPGQRTTPRLGPAGGFFSLPSQQPPRPATTVAPDTRPSSAFQLRPEVRSSSTVTVPQFASQGGPGGYPPYPPNGAGGPNRGPGPRPMVAQPLRPHDPGMRPSGHRIVSGPAGTPQFGGPRPNPPTGPPGPPPPGTSPSPRPPHMTPPQHGTAPPAPYHPQPPGAAAAAALDIGFSAPPDDRRNRAYGRRPSGTGAAAPTSPATAALPKSGSTPNIDPTGPGRTGTPATRPASARPQTEGRNTAKQAPPPPLEKMDTAPAAPAQQQQQQQQVVAKPARGPKTFDEMGVPAQKQESDCAVM